MTEQPEVDPKTNDHCEVITTPDAHYSTTLPTAPSVDAYAPPVICGSESIRCICGTTKAKRRTEAPSCPSEVAEHSYPKYPWSDLHPHEVPSVATVPVLAANPTMPHGYALTLP
jgi:hypothetical protein